MASLLLLLSVCVCSVPSFAFHASPSPLPFVSRIPCFTDRRLFAYAYAHAYASKQELSPQVVASGYSPQLDLLEAIQEATNIALQALPKPEQDAAIDLALITVSSLYDGQSQPSVVVPAVLRSASVYGTGVQNLIGCTTGGIVASVANLDMPQTTDNHNEVQPKACSTVESEGVPGVSVTLCLLPNVTVKV